MKARILKHPAKLFRYWLLAPAGGEKWTATLIRGWDRAASGIVTGDSLYGLQGRLNGCPWSGEPAFSHQGIPQLFEPIAVPPEYAEDVA